MSVCHQAAWQGRYPQVEKLRCRCFPQLFLHPLKMSSCMGLKVRHCWCAKWACASWRGLHACTGELMHGPTCTAVPVHRFGRCSDSRGKASCSSSSSAALIVNSQSLMGWIKRAPGGACGGVVCCCPGPFRAAIFVPRPSWSTICCCAYSLEPCSELTLWVHHKMTLLQAECLACNARPRNPLRVLHPGAEFGCIGGRQ